MAKGIRAKIKIENQPIVSGDCRQAIHWYINWLITRPDSARGLFATNFEQDDQLLLDSALTNLPGQGVIPLIVNGDDLYKQADDIWKQALNKARFGQPALSELETKMRDCRLLIISNLTTPASAQQLWYLYHYVLYPRALNEKPVLITTPLAFEEFVVYGAGCDDFEYAGHRLTWEKLVWLLNATMVNLGHAKLLQAEHLPVMLQPEYKLYRAIQARHLNATAQHIVNGKHSLAIAIVDQQARMKLDIECDFLHRFGILEKEYIGSKGKQSKTEAPKKERSELSRRTAEQLTRDHALIKEGWQVLRLSFKETTSNTEECADLIKALCTGGGKKITLGRLLNLSMFPGQVKLPAPDRDQLNVITHPAGPAAIVGGAGTGKSACIAQRVAFLISQGVSPERVLVISYSPETVQLIKTAVSPLVAGPLMDRGNFYAWSDLGMRIIKEHVSAIKRKLPLKLENNPAKVMQKLIVKYRKELDPTALELCGEFDEVTAAAMISLYKANLVTAQMFKEQAKTEREQLLALVYLGYEDQMQKANKIDKDDTVALAAQLLGQDVELRTQYQNLFEHIIVDEYQDASVACDFLARVLAFPNDNLILVGNEDEAIFESAGAAPRLLAETSIRAPESSCYMIGKNWRAHPQITKHAEQFADYIARVTQAERHTKKITISGWQAVDSLAMVGPYQFQDRTSEGNWIADQIETLLKAGRKLDDIAVICRSADQLLALEGLFSGKELMINSASPDTGLLLPDEAADVLAFLKLALDPDGPKAREYFERVCQLRSKAMAPKLSATIAGFAEANNLSYLKAVEIYSEAVADPVCRELEQLVKVIRAMHQNKLPPAQIINLLKRPQWLGGYYKSLKLPPGVNYEPLKVISQMHDDALPYKTLADFVKNYSPSSNLSQTKDVGHASLNLISVAEAKGREFQIVFVPNLAEGILPDLEKRDQEEERHIFYLCLTRARELLYLSCSSKIDNKSYEPSSFLAQAGLAIVPLAEQTIRPVELHPEQETQSITPQPEPITELSIAPDNEIIEEFMDGPVQEKKVSLFDQAVRNARKNKLEKAVAVFKCQNCHVLLEPGARFCGECGARQETIAVGRNCASCGAPMPAGAKFCGECGK